MTISSRMVGALALVTAAALPAPAAAEVAAAAGGGFATSHSAVVPASRWQVWEELLHPENWWTHTWSNDPMNLRLDARAGGCFCERVPVEGSWEAGEVEHGRVVALFPEQMLRLNGSLGPLQAEGVTGTLTVTLSEAGQGNTRIQWDYVVGGATRSEMTAMSSAVDKVQGEFLGSFASFIRQGTADR